MFLKLEKALVQRKPRWLTWEAVGVQVVSTNPVDIGGER